MNLTEAEIKKLQDLAGILVEKTQSGATEEAVNKIMGFVNTEIIGVNITPAVSKKVRTHILALAEYLASFKLLAGMNTDKNTVSESDIDDITKIQNKIEDAIRNNDKVLYDKLRVEMTNKMTTNKLMTKLVNVRTPEMETKIKKLATRSVTLKDYAMAKRGWGWTDLTKPK